MRRSIALVITLLACPILVGCGQSSGLQLIGYYSTSLVGRTPNQLHNAELASKHLNGKKVNPGAEFSFNKTLLGWDAGRGYRKAPVSYNGTLVDSWGGGVCQTSTTLYNAALSAGLTITQRNTHRFAPSYVPPGRDAAVAYESIDLTFKNPYNFPVVILAERQGERIVCRIMATQKPSDLPVIETRIEDRKSKGTWYLRDQGEGYKVRNSGKDGFTVQTYRRYGTRREWVSSDFYQAMDKVIALD